MGGFIDVAEWRILLQRVEPSFWQYAGPLWRSMGLYATSVHLAASRCVKMVDMADTLYPVLVVDLANVHRKMDYRRDRNPRAVAGLRWFAAPVFRSLYYGARGVLPAS